MTDNELIDYVEEHATTELGQIHRDHVARLLELAGLSSERLTRAWYFLDSEDVAPLVAKARARLSLHDLPFLVGLPFSQGETEGTIERARGSQTEVQLVLVAGSDRWSVRVRGGSAKALTLIDAAERSARGVTPDA